MEQGALFVFIIFGLLLLLVFWGVPIGVCLCLVAALGMFLARGQFPPIVHLLTYTFSELVLQYALRYTLLRSATQDYSGQALRYDLRSTQDRLDDSETG